MNGGSRRTDDINRFPKDSGSVSFTVAHGAVRRTTRMSRTRETEATRRRRADDRERARYLAAILITLLFIAFLGTMVYVSSLLPPPTGVLGTYDPVAKQWVVAWSLPNGQLYQDGMRTGDIITRVDGKSLSAPADATRPVDFGGNSTITVRLDSGEDRQLKLPTKDDNPIRVMAFALLALIFIGVGGPVFVKARQRTAAVAFYFFCICTAMALALGIGIVSNIEWVQVLMFTTLVTFAASFAFFFLKFPVRAGKTERQHTLLIAILVGGGLSILALYGWVLLGHPADYNWVRLMMALYLAACVGWGLLILVATMRAEQSPEVRQQLVILMGGTAVAVGPALFLTVIPVVFGAELVSVQVTVIALGIMPLAFAYAITQHQLLGVRSLVRRSVIYVLMGSTVMLAFAVAATVLRQLLPGDWIKTDGGLVGFSLFVFLVAFSFGHLQRRVEHLVDKYIYHDAYDYKDALLQFSSQLASQQDLDVLSEQLVERTCRLMNLSCGVLVLAVHPETERPPTLGTTRYRFPVPDSLLFEGVNLYDSGDNLRLLGVPKAGGSNGNGYHPAERSHDLSGSSAVVQVAAGNAEAPDPATFPGEAQPRRSTDGPNYLEVYAKYGDTADRMIDGLHEELSRLGVSLHEVELGALALQSNGLHAYESFPVDIDSVPSLVDDDESVPRVSSLVGAASETGFSEILTTGPLDSSQIGSDLETIRSFLGVPLWTRQRFVGVLCLAGKKTGERFTRDDLSLLSTLGSQAALAILNAQLSEAREQALLETIAALAQAIEAKDGYTSEHCEKMTDRAVALAQALGLPRQDVENVRLGAILHDVGKIGVPDAVLNKPGKLTNPEYEIIKQHARIGAGIVSTVKALKGVVPIVMHHQEKYDGSGYPLGLSGESIPLGARIIAVADTYGAMTEDRIYRKAPGHRQAIEELQRFAGQQFDPVVVDAFIRLLEEHPELGERPRPAERQVS